MSFIPAALLNALVFGGTLALAVFGVNICRAAGLMDVPDSRKQHKCATPLLGGLALTLITLPSTLGLLLASPGTGLSGPLCGVVVAIFAMSVVGLTDDRHSLTATGRILFASLIFATVALIYPAFSVRVLYFSYFGVKLGLGTPSLAVAFTTLCCVGLANAINMADGKNGLVIGLCIGWLLIVAHHAPAEFLIVIVPLLITLTVLLVFNLSGRLFLGDGGSYGFAAAVGLLTIGAYNSSNTTGVTPFSAEEVMLMFCVPVIDSFRLSYVRVRSGRSPMDADRDHLHHHLQNRLGWPRGLIVYLVMALLPSASIILFS